MKKILYFDASASGHHGEFMENVLYGLSSQAEAKLFILAHPDLRLRLLHAKADSGSDAQLHFLTAIEVDAIAGSSSVREQGRLGLDFVEQFCEILKELEKGIRSPI